MASALRMVLVTRRTDYQLLLARHGTRGQAAFFLSSRGRSIDELEGLDRRFGQALRHVQGAVPAHWRSARVDRGDLDRFVFEPADIVAALGQDGLVANLAKYLDGQTVIGLNPLPDRVDGVLARHDPADAGDLLATAGSGDCEIEARTMVEAELDDGQRLRCLNEIFVGHRSHQSARYTVEYAGSAERHSSSGMIVATGTGASGWARSVHRCTRSSVDLPPYGDTHLAWFAREPWPSVATGADLVEGIVDASRRLFVTSEMDEDGVVFGDGIETDRLEFGYGRRVEVRAAAQTLNLLVA